MATTGSARWAAATSAACTATLTIAASLLIFGAPATPAAAEPTQAAATTACRFVHGFAQMRHDLGALIGDCLEDEWTDTATGDSRQQTNRGLLHWRRADNLVAFTDGARTWVRNHNGAIHIRPNYERFAWEAPPGCTPTNEGKRR